MEKYLGLEVIKDSEFREGIVIESVFLDDMVTARVSEYSINEFENEEVSTIGTIDLVLLTQESDLKKREKILKNQLKDLGITKKVYISETVKEFFDRIDDDRK